MTQNPQPESLYDALHRLVEALGGAKRVGSRLWPEKTFHDARVRLLNCLNAERSEHLHPEQVVLILRWGCDIGFHDAANYIADVTGYCPVVPKVPAAEIDQLAKEATVAAQHAENAAAKLRAQLQAAHVNASEAMP